jgi:tetratricopeptide (TPR) repeat protein
MNSVVKSLSWGASLRLAFCWGLAALAALLLIPGTLLARGGGGHGGGGHGGGHPGGHAGGHPGAHHAASLHGGEHHEQGHHQGEHHEAHHGAAHTGPNAGHPGPGGHPGNFAHHDFHHALPNQNNANHNNLANHNFNNHYWDHNGWHGNYDHWHNNWHHGYWNGWGAWPANWGGYGYGNGYGYGAAAGLGALAGLGTAAALGGYGGYGGGYAYSNPYYDGYAGTGYDYSQPIQNSTALADNTGTGTSSATAAEGSLLADNGVQTITNPYTSEPTTQQQQGLAAMDSARSAFKRGDYAEAQQFADKAVSLLPDDSAVHEFRALTLFAQQKYKDAAAGVYAVLSNGPGWNEETLRSLYGDSKAYDQQLTALQNYAKENPQAADARFLLAYHDLTAGNLDTARNELEQVAQLEPKDHLAPELVKALGAPRTETGDSKTS